MDGQYTSGAQYAVLKGVTENMFTFHRGRLTPDGPIVKSYDIDFKVQDNNNRFLTDNGQEFTESGITDIHSLTNELAPLVPGIERDEDETDDAYRVFRVPDGGDIVLEISARGRNVLSGVLTYTSISRSKTHVPEIMRKLDEWFASRVNQPAAPAQPAQPYPVPAGSEDPITREDINNGDSIVDFNNEFSFGRYYHATTLPRLNGRNPTNRQLINRTTIKYYIAQVPEGGKRKRKTRKRKTRRKRHGKTLKRTGLNPR